MTPDHEPEAEPIDLPEPAALSGVERDAAMARVVDRGRQIRRQRRTAIASAAAVVAVMLVAIPAIALRSRDNATVDVSSGDNAFVLDHEGSRTSDGTAPTTCTGVLVGPNSCATGGSTSVVDAPTTTICTTAGPPGTNVCRDGTGATWIIGGEPTPTSTCGAPACGSTTTATVLPPSTSSTSSTPTTLKSQPTLTGTTFDRPPALPGATTDPKVTPRAEIPTASLVAIRVGRQDGYDRVVFEFGGGVPGYDVRYVDPPITMDASGDPVAVAGGSFLMVRMDPASGWDMEQGVPTYTGADRIPGAGPAVAEVVDAGDFEAVLHWAIGVNGGARPFTVTTLQSPSRIVIDIRH